MCGIVGYLDVKDNNLKPGLDSIKHRGPDAVGEYLFRTEGGNTIGLGHVRLSIIDLSSGANQPFSTDDGKCTIIFNGEIYNFIELKNDLENKGRVFRTKSDTEVLIQMYQEFGIEMVSKLDGIFSFSLLDENENKLFLVRDHLGVKPLYYSVTSSAIFFASEIKALNTFNDLDCSIDYGLISEFLLNGFVYEPETGYKNIKKLMPGSYMEISCNEGISSQKIIPYWKPNSNVKRRESVERLINQSIESQILSDVPIGLFFSGGIDSSIILSKLRGKIDSIVIEADKKEYKEAGMTNDYDYATKIAKIFNTPLKSVKISENSEMTGDEFLKYVDQLSLFTEEPIADFTFISSQLLSKSSKKLGYTVMLSGMGADELFAGYPRYRLVKFENRFKMLKYFANSVLGKMKFFAKKIERFNSFLETNNFIFKYASLVGVFSQKEVNELQFGDADFSRFENKLTNLLSDYEQESKLKKSMVLDFYGFLSHNFSVADKSSMLEAIELRVPLATKDLFEKGFSMEDDELLSFKFGKLPLRNILFKVLPKKIVNRRKAGFNPPMDEAIRKLSVEKCIDFMEIRGLFTYLDKSIVSIVLKDHFSGKKNNTYKIFNLLYLSSWLNNGNKNKK